MEESGVLIALSRRRSRDRSPSGAPGPKAPQGRDLTDYVTYDLAAVEPTILQRDDGHALIYPGLVQWIAGEPESGETWAAMLAVKEQLEAGRTVVYFDYEMSPRRIIRRLRQMGTPAAAITRGLVYIRPSRRMTDDILEMYGSGSDHDRPLLAGASLVVFDAFAQAMGTEGYDPLSNEDVAAWLNRAPRLAKALGAAVLILDHVVKDYEARGR